MRKCIEDYLASHQSSYVGRYRYHSNLKTKRREYKFLYYILDNQYHRVNVYVVIDYSGDVLNTNFSIDLHEQEKEYITKDALFRMNFFNNFPTIIHLSTIDSYMEMKDFSTPLEPLDYRNIFDYLEYHRGTSQEIVDEFYRIYLPYLDQIINLERYKDFVDSFILILDKVVYEYEWDGEMLKYYDTQFQFHVYYFCRILKYIKDNIDVFYARYPRKILYIFTLISRVRNLGLMMYINIKDILFARKDICDAFFKYIYEFDEKLKEDSFIKLMYSEYTGDKEEYDTNTLDILRDTITAKLTYANSDLQMILADSIIGMEGHNVLINLFKRDYNTFIFIAFPIKTFPKRFYGMIKDELEKAIRFYAARMENNEYWLSSFEQVMNIYRLLQDNYSKEEIR